MVEWTKHLPFFGPGRLTSCSMMRFAKALYLKRVPRVRIPPSPVLFPQKALEQTMSVAISP
jgi:hypothetical protein